jgi:antitoxin (DNA-binding transcriptional repressor) of toxin-antitoxin stability system
MHDQPELSGNCLGCHAPAPLFNYFAPSGRADENAVSPEGIELLTKHGRPVAVLVAVGEEDELERLVLAHTPRLRRLLEEAEERIEATGGVRHKDFWASVRARSKRAKSR